MEETKCDVGLMIDGDVGLMIDGDVGLMIDGDVWLMIDADLAEKRMKTRYRDVKLLSFKHTLATDHLIQCPTQ